MLVACRENLVIAKQVVKELSGIGEEIQLHTVGTFLDNANVAVKWTMKGKSYSKDRAAIVSMQLQKLLTIHEIYLSQEHSESDFEMLSRMPHIGKIMIEGYSGEGLDLVPKDRTESLFLYQVKSIVPVDKLFPVIAKINSLRELQLNYNNPAAPKPIASLNSTAVSFSSLSKLECLSRITRK